jgi:hypothetical protein
MTTRKSNNRIVSSKNSETCDSIESSDNDAEAETEEETEETEESEEVQKTIYQNGKDIVTNYCSIIITTAKSTTYIIYDAVKIYLLWALLHYFAGHYYVPFCSPYGIWGFIITPILAATPQCKALRWIITTGGNTMETMWVIFGVWACSQVIPSTISNAANTVNTAASTVVNTIKSSNKPPPKYNIRSRSRSYDYINDKHNKS